MIFRRFVNVGIARIWPNVSKNQRDERRISTWWIFWKIRCVSGRTIATGLGTNRVSQTASFIEMHRTSFLRARSKISPQMATVHGEKWKSTQYLIRKMDRHRHLSLDPPPITEEIYTTGSLRLVVRGWRVIDDCIFVSTRETVSNGSRIRAINKILRFRTTYTYESSPIGNT